VRAAVIRFLDACRTGMCGGSCEIATSHAETPLTVILEQEACRTGMVGDLVLLVVASSIS
jgi:hypothetical protein